MHAYLHICTHPHIVDKVEVGFRFQRDDMVEGSALTPVLSLQGSGLGNGAACLKHKRLGTKSLHGPTETDKQPEESQCSLKPYNLKGQKSKV